MNRIKLLGIALMSSILCLESATADIYALDHSHTGVGFTIKHMGISNVRGEFRDFDGKVTMNGEDPLAIQIEATIKAESVDTNNTKRDDHLRNEDFFHVANYPEITFVSTGVEPAGEGFLLKGDLTMHGVTKEVILGMSIAGPIEDPWGNQRIGLELNGSLMRHDFGVGSDKTSDKLIGKEVEIEINAEAIKQ